MRKERPGNGIPAETHGEGLEDQPRGGEGQEKHVGWGGHGNNKGMTREGQRHDQRRT